MILQQTEVKGANGLLIVHVETTETNIATIGEHIACLEDNHLTARTLQEMGKSPRQSTTWIGDKRIDGANEWILSTINIVLVGLTAVTWRGLVEPCNRHSTDVSTFCNAAITSLIIKPIAADDADGARRLFYVVDDFLTGLHSSHIGIADGITTEDRIFNKVDGTRLVVVEDHCDISLFRAGIKVTPLSDITFQDTGNVGNGDAGVCVLLVLDECQSIET